MTLIAGYLSGDIPWMWIIMATSIAFASISGGLLWFDQLLDRWRVAEKLIFAGPFIGFDKTPDKKSIENIQIGFVLENRATFPVSYTVKNIRTSADGTIPTTGSILSWGGVIQAGSSETFKDRTIHLKQAKADIDATMEFELTYGPHGREKHQMMRSISISVRYDPHDGRISFPWSHVMKTM
jgi:hypothetical protein